TGSSFCCFSLPSSRPTLDLLSFPTRRSSDLHRHETIDFSTLMKRWFGITASALGLASAVATVGAQPASTGRPNFSGAWTLNRDLGDKTPSGLDVSGTGRRDDPRGGPERSGRPGGLGPGGHRG